MPRPQITTVYTPRVKPTTQYTRPRELDCITWDEITYTWDNVPYTWDWTCFWWVNTTYTRPRKAKYVQDLTWANILDLSWNQVQWISGNEVNKINTVYT